MLTGRRAPSQSGARRRNSGGRSVLRRGAAASLALESGGSVWAWGAGDLGNASTSNSSVPVQVPGITGATQIAAGNSQSLVLTSSGTVSAWGSNTYGEDGNGTTRAQTSPVAVSGLTGVTQIAAGT